MKKLVFLMLFLLLPVSAFANDTTVKQSSKEANFSLELESSWDQMTVTKTKQGKNPAWKVDFASSAATANMPLAMFVIDGRKSEDVKQTSADFKSGQAEVLMLQIVSADKEAGSKDGFVLTENEIKKYGTRSFIWIKKENRSLRAVRYYILTAFDDYIYSINCQTEVKTIAEQQAAVKNLELMMRTLRAYGKG